MVTKPDNNVSGVQCIYRWMEGVCFVMLIVGTGAWTKRVNSLGGVDFKVRQLAASE